MLNLFQHLYQIMPLYHIGHCGMKIEVMWGLEHIRHSGRDPESLSIKFQHIKSIRIKKGRQPDIPLSPFFNFVSEKMD